MPEERKTFIYLVGRPVPVQVRHHEGGFVRISDGYVQWRVSKADAAVVTKSWSKIETISEGSAAEWKAGDVDGPER